MKAQNNTNQIVYPVRLNQHNLGRELSNPLSNLFLLDYNEIHTRVTRN
jgi:hypothetical protein